MIVEALIEAIRDGKNVSFYYDGIFRIVEPHVVGRLKGNESLLGIQLDGESVGGILPGWRRFSLSKIQALEVSEKTTFGSSWDEVYAFRKEVK